MKTTADFVRAYICQLQFGAIFSSQSLLGYGRRAAVYSICHRLVKEGALERLSSGLYMRGNREQVELPSMLDIAIAKAESAGELVVGYGFQLAGSCRVPDEETEREFLVLGRSRSFNSCHGRLHLRAVASSKLWRLRTEDLRLASEMFCSRLFLELTKGQTIGGPKPDPWVPPDCDTQLPSFAPGDDFVRVVFPQDCLN